MKPLAEKERLERNTEEHRKAQERIQKDAEIKRKQKEAEEKAERERFEREAQERAEKKRLRKIEQERPRKAATLANNAVNFSELPKEKEAFPTVATPMAHYVSPIANNEKWTVGLNAENVLVAVRADGKEFPMTYSCHDDSWLCTDGYIVIFKAQALSKELAEGQVLPRKLTWVAVNTSLTYESVNARFPDPIVWHATHIF